MTEADNPIFDDEVNPILSPGAWVYLSLLLRRCRSSVFLGWGQAVKPAPADLGKSVICEGVPSLAADSDWRNAGEPTKANCAPTYTEGEKAVFVIAHIAAIDEHPIAPTTERMTHAMRQG